MLDKKGERKRKGKYVAGWKMRRVCSMQQCQDPVGKRMMHGLIWPCIKEITRTHTHTHTHLFHHHPHGAIYTRQHFFFGREK